MEKLTESEYNERWLMTDESNGRRWGHWKDEQFESCRVCGAIRRGDDQNPKCRGEAKIDLRLFDDPST